MESSSTRQKSRGLRHGTVGLTLIAALALGCGAQEEGDGGGAEALSAASSAPDAAPSAEVRSRPGAPPAALSPRRSQVVDISELGFDEGSADAPIRVVEFSDFGCGYCRKFHEETYPTLVERYVDEGVIQWKYVTYVSGMFPNGMEAAFAAECAGEQDRFRPVRDRLFGTQREWKSFSKSEAEAFFRGLVVEAGVDAAQYDACLAEGRRRDRVRSGILAGGQIGVRGTPTFLFDGYPIMGALPLDFFENAISLRLEELGNQSP